MGKFIDLTGQRFGRLVVIERAENDRYKRARWLCRCDCGKNKIINSQGLRRGSAQSCGCLHRQEISIRQLNNITGQRFGRLVVLERAENGNHNQTRWKCLCDCGNTTIVLGGNLQSGNTKSCGCLGSELTASGQRTKKHGKTGTRLYRIWHAMRNRCHATSQDNYKYYGARGIKVCPEWEHDFVAFRNWALSHGYQDNLTIDRIDPNGNYEPSNCRWLSIQDQQRNRRPQKGGAH